MNAIYIFYNLEENTTKLFSVGTQLHRSNVWLKLEFKAITKQIKSIKLKIQKNAFKSIYPSIRARF